jgi:hypothetical protein
MKTIKVDGVGINAGHLALMEKKAAIRELILLGGNPGRNAKQKAEWARRVYKLIKEQ